MKHATLGTDRRGVNGCATLACPACHYQTTVTDTGRLAWTDGTRPPEINHAHHPEELLRGNTDPPDTQQD